MNYADLLEIRFLQENDLEIILKAGEDNNWPKPKSLFESYLYEQYLQQRMIWLGFLEKKLVGYCTLKWKSAYMPFRAENIAEIKDLNVFPNYRKQGIASKLLDCAENAAFQKNDLVGIGVGLSEDYGNAQKLYIQRGYVPDGRGIVYNNLKVGYGHQIVVDDELNLMLIKRNKAI